MNAHIDPDVFEQRFERAIREPSSMPRPYHDWDNPANWEQFTGNTTIIPDGEIVLVFRSSAIAAYAFRQYVAASDCFMRLGGGRLHSEDCDSIYRYTDTASHETDICCPNLEEVL